MQEVRNLIASPVIRAFAALSALALGLIALPLALGAQEATPESQDGIPPIVWQLTTIDDGAGGTTTVEDPGSYTIQFLPDGRVGIGADCNQGVADFVIDGNSVTFGEMATTLALCPPESLSDQYLAHLQNVATFAIDQSQASDQLVLELADGGSLVFAPSLIGVTWQWQQFQGGDGTTIAPDDPSKFALEFQKDGTVFGQVDCNRASGTYTADGVSIEILLATTRMFCGEGSLDTDFGRFVSESNTYVIRDGNLSLALPMDGGITTFAPHIDDPFASPEAGA